MIVNIVTLLCLACVVKASVIINVYDQVAADADVQSSHSLSACNPSDCNRFCRNAGFDKGECFGNWCRCSLESKILENKADYSVLDSCNDQSCDQLCRKLGMPGGLCVEGKCTCISSEPTKITENKAASVPDCCNDQSCNQFCRKLGLPGGHCVEGRCTCIVFEPTKITEFAISTETENDAAEEYINVHKKIASLKVAADADVQSSHSLSACNPNDCNRFCRNAGFDKGECFGNWCRCSLESIILENKAAYSVPDCCNDQSCDQFCRKLGMPGGHCVEGGCTCIVFEPTKITGKTMNHLLGLKPKAAHSLDDCNFRACDQLCRNLGFPGGACVGDKCDCDNFKKNMKEIKESAVSTETENDAAEESINVHKKMASLKDILLRDEGMGQCNYISCTEMCLRLNYMFGTCENGSCICI